VQFSLDSSKLASASRDKKVIVWDARTGARLHTLESRSAVVTTMQFSADGSKLALVSYNKKVMVWDSRTGARLHALDDHPAVVIAMHFSPDGNKLASASDDKKVMVWDTSIGARLHTLDGHSAGVRAVQFSADASKLASVSGDKEVMVWDLHKTPPIETINVEDHVSDLTSSADGFYFRTNTSSFKFKSTVGASHDENTCSLHLQVREDWILRHGHKTIWLPPELRSYQGAAAVSEALIAFGHSSGIVSFWEITD
jgi:WD40 repeat protein